MRVAIKKLEISIPVVLAIMLLVTSCSKATDTTSTAGYGTVTESTQTDTVESSGSIEPYQITTLTWKTSGTVMTVDIAANQVVVKGTVIATIDPTSAPTSVNEAISDLIIAKQELEDAKNSKTALAQAEVTCICKK